jgi:hypothetical protein
VSYGKAPGRMRALASRQRKRPFLPTFGGLKAVFLACPGPIGYEIAHTPAAIVPGFLLGGLEQ